MGNSSNDTLDVHVAGGAVEQFNADGFQLRSITQASLPAASDGTVLFCSDCNPDATCTGSGAGAFAFRIGGAWACELN